MDTSKKNQQSLGIVAEKERIHNISWVSRFFLPVVSYHSQHAVDGKGGLEKVYSANCIHFIYGKHKARV
jgi:hypothetical protein